MELPIPKPLKDIWESWEIRAFILFSMFLQSFLILFSPLRKRCASIWIYMSIWSAYLLADWVASFAVGLISSSQSNMSCNSKKGITNPDLYAFWVSFLLVHLGGPDTITAFALEDNELWRRHMLTLIFQSISAVYVFYQTLPQNQLWMPTMFMFISGIIKYAERTYSLYLASLDTFRDHTLRDPDAGPNYAKLMDEYYSMEQANLPTSIKMFPEPMEEKTINRVKEANLTKEEVVLHAHRLFETFKGLIVDIILSFRERNLCRNFFLKRSAKDAFDVIEAELNYIYDVLFTKVRVVYNIHGYVLRFVSSSLVIASLYLFYFENKSYFRPADVAITYTLLLGAISLDAIAMIMFIDSDWFKIFTYKLPAVNIEGSKSKNGIAAAAGSKKLEHLLRAGSKKLKHLLRAGSKKPGFSIFGDLKHLLRRRWSESVPGYNLLHFSQHGRYSVVEKILSLLALADFFDRLQYVKRKPFSVGLRNHIFTELKEKSEMAEDLATAKEMSAAKGNWALAGPDGCIDLLPYVLEKDYDQSLLLWHIATELCYCDDVEHDNENKQGDNVPNYKEFSKCLSDYMLYLLVMQPTMVSAVAGIGKIRFKDTCEEAKKFFRTRPTDAAQNTEWWHCPNVMDCFSRKREKEMIDPFHVKRCKQILAVHTEVDPVTLKGEKSKSVLFDGCILAKKLMGEQKKWEIMSKVWVEMLSYAAINCRANAHAQQLARGGELLTVVWLLMVQFGLGNQFQIDEGHARAKLMVGK